MMTFGNVLITKKDIEEMLSTSESDYKDYLKDKKISKLRDAVNKLYAVAENITEAKTGKPVKNYGEFRHNFLKEFNDNDLLVDLGTLHTFFYNGLGYEQKTKDIEYLYGKSKKKLRNLMHITFKRELVKV
jgi:hypothetical protein